MKNEEVPTRLGEWTITSAGVDGDGAERCPRQRLDSSVADHGASLSG